MLKICQSSLPQSFLSYVAFRVAFRNTFERLALQTRQRGEVGEFYGYLGEVPFLREVPSHVQLDLLSQTWNRHLSREPHSATLVDEAVIYAVCEASARLIERDLDLFAARVRGGPIDLSVPIDLSLARDLRLLYLELPNDADFLLVSQFLDMDPEEASRQKRDIGIDVRRLNELFDVLGQWHTSPDLAMNLKGLLSAAELAAVAAVMRDHRRNITHQS